MDTQKTLTRRRTSLFRRIGWLAVAALATLALVGPGAGVAAAASVTPYPINEGNPTCGDFDGTYGGGQTWQEYKVEPPGNGTYNVGAGKTVTITNFQNSSSGTPGSFDWSSNFGVDSVFVKAGSTKHNLYVYAPTAASTESYGDTGLGPQSGTGNGISHISFCWDTDNPPTTPPTEPPTTPPTEPPTTPPTEPPTEPPADQANLIVYKLLDIDGDGDPNTGDLVPAEDWTFDVAATGGTPTSAQGVTSGEEGSVTFDFDVAEEGVMVDVSEQLLEDYEFIGAVCLVDEEVEVGSVGDGEVTDIPIAAGETVECWFVNTSGGEEPATATPKQVTPPPTDTLGLTSGSGSDSWRIVLLGMAALLATLLLFTPAERAVSRRRR